MSASDQKTSWGGFFLAFRKLKNYLERKAEVEMNLLRTFSPFVPLYSREHFVITDYYYV